MQRSKTKQLATRWVVYLVGMFVLAAGLTLNTKTGLGASAIVSVAHTISLCTGFTLGNIKRVCMGNAWEQRGAALLCFGIIRPRVVPARRQGGASAGRIC